jgi:nucleoid DNA-binding protein
MEKEKLWTGAMLPEIADAAGDNEENAQYIVAAFIEVLAGHLTDGYAVGLKGLGTITPTLRGELEFKPARGLLEKLSRS